MKSYISQIFSWCPLFVVPFCFCCCWCCCRCCFCCCLYHFYRFIFVSLYLIKSKFFQFYVTLLNSGQFFILFFLIMFFYFILFFIFFLLFYFILYFIFFMTILFYFVLNLESCSKGKAWFPLFSVIFSFFCLWALSGF